MAFRTEVLEYIQLHNPLYQEVLHAFPGYNYLDVHNILLDLEGEKVIECQRTKEGYRYSATKTQE